MRAAIATLTSQPHPWTYPDRLVPIANSFYSATLSPKRSKEVERDVAVPKRFFLYACNRPPHHRDTFTPPFKSYTTLKSNFRSGTCTPHRPVLSLSSGMVSCPDGGRVRLFQQKLFLQLCRCCSSTQAEAARFNPFPSPNRDIRDRYPSALSPDKLSRRACRCKFHDPP